MNIKLLRSLNVFVKVADAGNMSVAAKSLHMTVSAISQQLRKLETDIGLSLFNRNTRHLSLTEAGRIYYRSAVKMLDEARQAHFEIEQLQQTPSGELRITAPVGFGGGLLSQPLKQLLAEFPRIKVSLELTDYPDDVISSGADLAISLFEAQDTNLHCEHLATWDRVLCAAATHPVSRATATNELEQHEYLAHELFQSMTLSTDNGDSYVLDTPAMMVNSMQGLIQLTCDGLGYAVLPEPEVRKEIASGSLIQLMPRWTLPTYSVYAVAPRHLTIPGKTQAAIDSLRAAFGQI